MAYDNPGGLIAASVILQVLVFVCVGIRLASRRKLRQRLLASDLLIVAAMTSGLALTIIQIYGCAVQALGVPLDDSLSNAFSITGRFNKARHIELSFLLWGIVSLGLIKVSVSCFYYHIFDTPIFRRVLILWIVLIITWTITFITGGLAECGSHLLALFSTPQAYLKHCGSAIPTGIVLVSTNLATDLGTLILPIPMVWSLRMSTHRKLAVLAAFMVGLLSIGASIAKTYIYITNAIKVKSMDAILLITAFGTWNLIEVQVGIIAACGPTMIPVLKDLGLREGLIVSFTSLRGWLARDRHSERYGSGHPSKKPNSDESLSIHEAKADTIVSRVEVHGSSSTDVNIPPSGIYVSRDVNFITTR